MDLFDYASELFNGQGELHVPGLGHFTESRKDSYYSNGLLYPPQNQINFNADAEEDNDELVSYFAGKKRISPASARYFVDKLVGQLKEQAATGEAPFADLGIFYDNNGILTFKPKQSGHETDPALFGFAPVEFTKLSDLKEKTVVPTPRLETTSPEAGPAVLNDTTSAPQQAITPKGDAVNTEDKIIILNSSLGRDQEKSTSALLWTIYAVVTMAIVGAFLWYYNTHTLANDKVNAENNPVNQSYNAGKKISIAAASKADLDTATANKALSDDSAAAITKSKALSIQATTTNVETTTVPAPEVFKNSWVVSGGQNNDYAGAARLQARYRGQGYPQARMIDSVKKKEWFIYRVIFGFYDTKQQAIAARRQLLKQGKLNPKYLTVQPTNKEQ